MSSKAGQKIIEKINEAGSEDFVQFMLAVL